MDKQQVKMVLLTLKGALSELEPGDKATVEGLLNKLKEAASGCEDDTVFMALSIYYFEESLKHL